MVGYLNNKTFPKGGEFSLKNWILVLTICLLLVPIGVQSHYFRICGWILLEFQWKFAVPVSGYSKLSASCECKRHFELIESLGLDKLARKLTRHELKISLVFAVS